MPPVPEGMVTGCPRRDHVAAQGNWFFTAFSYSPFLKRIPTQPMAVRCPRWGATVGPEDAPWLRMEPDLATAERTNS